MSRLTRTFVLSLLVAVQLLALPSSAYGDQWSPSLTVPPNSDGVSFVDNYQWNAISYIAASTNSSNGSAPAVQCSTFTSSGPCALNLPGSTGTVTALLPICESATSTNCVASMALGASGESMVPSTYVAMTDGAITPSDPKLGVPAGASQELWTNPLANLGGTTTYTTLVETQFVLAGGQVVSANLSAAIYPYNQISQDNTAPFVTVNPQGQVVVEGGTIECAFTTATTCGRLEDFPVGTQASLSIRVSNLVSGWFKGRLQNPAISEAPFDATSNVISVTAGVVTVPTLSFVAAVSQVQSDPSIGKFISDLDFPPPPTAAAAYVLTDSPEALTALNDIRGAVNNTAAGQVTVWDFGTLPSWTPTSGANVSCLNDKAQVDGMVTTNSMAYQPGPPSVSGGYFSYSVAGMHYGANGSVTSGTYDLAIRNSVAQCLYGFTSAPISATVTVTENSSGEQSVATTSVIDSNGWLHVGAYGFNFSNPTISVRLTQNSPRHKRTTISCVKGKSTKKVTAVHPRCPSGYKKK